MPSDLRTSIRPLGFARLFFAIFWQNSKARSLFALQLCQFDVIGCCVDASPLKSLLWASSEVAERSAFRSSFIILSVNPPHNSQEAENYWPMT
eukprot:scaffold326317_cov33-Prasinocladus_malaysianus.AAC.1